MMNFLFRKENRDGRELFSDSLKKFILVLVSSSSKFFSSTHQAFKLFSLPGLYPVSK